MTKPLLAILLLLPLSVGAGELDGKAIICESEGFEAVNGVRFQQGEGTSDRPTGLDLIKKHNGKWGLSEGNYSIKRDILADDDNVYVVERKTISWEG